MASPRFRHVVLSLCVLVPLGLITASITPSRDMLGIGRPAATAPAIPPPPPPPPPPHWSAASLHALRDAIDASRGEGLNPADYHRDELATAIAANASGPAVDLLALEAARTLAHDYAAGRVERRGRFGWHIEQPPAALASLDPDLRRAIEGQGLPAWLDGLLPQDPRYAALRDALQATPAGEPARRAHIRASMERWRWMPRRLGDDYILVNVPAYRLTYVERGTPVTTHDVVVGAPGTPTPMIAATIGAVIVNPWWTLPPTVLAEGKHYPASRGYVYRRIGGRMVVRQRPGPANALGRIKIDMPNAYAIYLHDTPAKWAFAKADRALSHGCIRVKDVQGLADRLADPATIDAALTTTTTRTLDIQRRIPVYIAYFTAGEDADGRVVTYPDPYARDASLIAALDGTDHRRARLASNAN